MFRIITCVVTLGDLNMTKCTAHHCLHITPRTHFGHSLYLDWQKLSYFWIFDLKGFTAYRSWETLTDAAHSTFLLHTKEKKVQTCCVLPLTEVDAPLASGDEFSVTQWCSGSHLAAGRLQVGCRAWSPFSLEFACSPRVCVKLLPTVQQACSRNVNSELAVSGWVVESGCLSADVTLW